MTNDHKLAVWWIRRDLRLKDNPAAAAAAKQGFDLVPLFILDPVILESPRTGKARKWFLYQGLRDLDSRLSEQGARLVVRSGYPRQVLQKMVQEEGVQKVFAEEDFTPYAKRRDRSVRDVVDLEIIPGLTLSRPNSIRANSGEPYQVYSHYRNKWKEMLQEDLRSRSQIDQPLNFSKQEFSREPIPDFTGFSPPDGVRAGEQTARDMLEKFTGGEDPPIYLYQEQRNRPDIQGTSGLSSYLHFGMLSTREVFSAAQQAMDRAGNQSELQSAETWLDELIWREFFLYILHHHPRVLRETYREKLSRIPWRNDQEEFSRWKEGRTGFPLVDAGMRQLLKDHWMHNRVRMVTASFLVKDLLIDWRWGEDWFMKQLLDADLASNNGGWQWVAGTGTDAAPYFRIFNPTTQAEKHDPKGVYIRKYIPELRQVPRKYIHAPWKMPDAAQAESNCIIGEDYPAPLVDHSQARQRTLEAYQLARELAQK